MPQQSGTPEIRSQQRPNGPSGTIGSPDTQMGEVMHEQTGPSPEELAWMEYQVSQDAEGGGSSGGGVDGVDGVDGGGGGGGAMMSEEECAWLDAQFNQQMGLGDGSA